VAILKELDLIPLVTVIIFCKAFFFFISPWVKIFINLNYYTNKAQAVVCKVPLEIGEQT